MYFERSMYTAKRNRYRNKKWSGYVRFGNMLEICTKSPKTLSYYMPPHPIHLLFISPVLIITIYRKIMQSSQSSHNCLQTRYKVSWKTYSDFGFAHKRDNLAVRIETGFAHRLTFFSQKDMGIGFEFNY